MQEKRIKRPERGIKSNGDHFRAVDQFKCSLKLKPRNDHDPGVKDSLGIRGKDYGHRRAADGSVVKVILHAINDDGRTGGVHFQLHRAKELEATQLEVATELHGSVDARC